MNEHHGDIKEFSSLCIFLFRERAFILRDAKIESGGHYVRRNFAICILRLTYYKKNKCDINNKSTSVNLSSSTLPNGHDIYTKLTLPVPFLESNSVFDVLLPLSLSSLYSHWGAIMTSALFVRPKVI